MGELAGLGPCDIAAGDKPGCCSWCHAPLTGRQRRWCADHRDEWARHHVWSWARLAVRTRADDCCENCGRRNGTYPADFEWWWALLRRWCPEGHPDDRVEGWRARRASWSAAWRLRPASLTLEVNHKTPVRGGHATPGCHHHLDELEALCRDCHQRVTNAQRAAGWRQVDTAAVLASSSDVQEVMDFA